ncbi:MAG: hypothetical protein OES47_15390, partial [Acidobacteriota bacterium]|nr:hypothetical protein [Acidobacteriota bacterium]
EETVSAASRTKLTDSTAAQSHGEGDATPPLAGATTATGSSGEDSGKDPGRGSGQDPAEPGAEAAAEPAAATSDQVATLPDPATADEVVRSWAASWSDQRVEDYLSYYATDFVPADGLARTQWVQQRRVRVARPASLEVAVQGLKREVVAPGRIRMTFNQTYQSDTFGDQVNKTLDLIWEEDAWKIVREFSDPP